MAPNNRPGHDPFPFETPEERADIHGTDPIDEAAADQDECDRALEQVPWHDDRQTEHVERFMTGA